MKFLITLLITVQTFAIDLPINEQSLTCSSGNLTVAAPDISHLVSGNYPKFEFKVVNLEHPCFFRIYLIDKASENGGRLFSGVKVSKTTIREPIYKCAPKPCPFCDPGDCQIVGHREFLEETVYLDVLGLRFSGTSKFTDPLQNKNN